MLDRNNNVCTNLISVCVHVYGCVRACVYCIYECEHDYFTVNNGEPFVIENSKSIRIVLINEC